MGSPRRVGPEAIGGFWDETRSMADALDLVPMGFRVVVGNEAVLTLQARPVIGGQTFTLDIVDHMTFDDTGKIVALRAFFDPATMAPLEGDRSAVSPSGGGQTRPVIRSTAISMATRSARSPGLAVARRVPADRLGHPVGVVGHGRRPLEGQPAPAVDLADHRSPGGPAAAPARRFRTLRDGAKVMIRTSPASASQVKPTGATCGRAVGAQRRQRGEVALGRERRHLGRQRGEVEGHRASVARPAGLGQWSAIADRTGAGRPTPPGSTAAPSVSSAGHRA